MGHRDLLLKIFLSFVFALLVFSLGITNNAYLIFALCNSTVCIFQLFSHNESPYSFHKVIHLFVIVFFVFANAIQFAHHSVVSALWVSFSDQEYVYFQVLTLAILLIYNVAYAFIDQFIGESTKDMDREGVINQRLLLFVAIAAVLIVLWHFREAPIRLVLRGIQGDSYRDALESSHTDLIFSKFLRVIPSACLLCGILAQLPKRITFFLLLLSLITAFPTGLSRNAVVMYWLPPILAGVSLFKKKRVFIIVMLVGIFIIFPFMGNFRYYNGDVSLSFDLTYFDSINYDASQQFMAVIKKNLVTNGRQLLGALLFFIPRSIWPSKPIGSGAMMAVNEFSFSNISMPCWGEGYINFSWFGLFLFDLILAVFSIYMDRRYWNRQEFLGRSVSDGYYLIICSALFFVLRGDLMSSFSFTVGALFTYLFVEKLTFRRIAS